MPQRVMFSQVLGQSVYDLFVDGRVVEYDVHPDDFGAALRRARVDTSEVVIEDDSGYRQRLGR